MFRVEILSLVENGGDDDAKWYFASFQDSEEEAKEFARGLWRKGVAGVKVIELLERTVIEVVR